MTQPYNKRIAAADLAETVETARLTADVRSLHRQIRAEVEAELNTMPTFEKVN